MTQMFASRAELIPAEETIQEHKKWQEEEAALVEKDKTTTGSKGGLFRGCFRLTRRRQMAVIRDDEDGVDRCPRCTWELEDGFCESCGYPRGEDSAEMSDSDGHGQWDDDLYDMEGATMEELVGALGDDARTGGYTPNFDFSEHGYSSEDGSSAGNPPRSRQRGRRMTAVLNRLRARTEETPPYDSFLDDTDEGSEDEEAGSLDNFIVNTTRTSLHWETDEGTDREGNQPHISDNDQNSQDEASSTSSAIGQYDPEDESDEGPILRSRRRVRQRSVASNQSSASDGSGSSSVSQALNALRMRNGYTGSQVSANAQRNIPHRNPDAHGERSTGSPIEIESDSDSPVPAQHTRRRRAIQHRLSSNDDTDVEASSGTATVGRDSPRLVTTNTSSPILIESSSTRSANRQLAVPGAFPQGPRSDMSHTSPDTNNSRHISRAPTRANRGEDHSFQGMSTRRYPANASPSSGIQQHRGTRRRSPLPPRAHPRSPTSRQSHSPSAREAFEQGRRDRQAQKVERRAERRRLKTEREQRGRPQSAPSLSPESWNRYEDL